MLGRVKKWLGIEGVRLEIIAPGEVDRKTGLITGSLRFESINPQIVNHVKLVLIEKYARGKGKEKLVDEYELGVFESSDLIEVSGGEVVEIPFALSFQLFKSQVDLLEESNLVARGLASAAKWIRGVKSDYRLEAEAKVKGVMLNPFDRKSIRIK